MQWDDGRIRLMPGDCRDLIAMLPDNSVDSVLTSSPRLKPGDSCRM